MSKIPEENIQMDDMSTPRFYEKDSDEELLDDYDPHDHRVVNNPTTNFETFIHMLKGSLGTGILAMPEAFKHAGILNGTIFTVLIACLCTYGLHILVNAQYILCKRLKVPLLTYPDSMKVALSGGPKILSCFANIAPIIVDVFLVAYQVGVCCVYVMFVAANLKELLDAYLNRSFSIQIYTLIILIPFILVLSIPNLKWLAPFSLFSNCVTLVCFGILWHYIFDDLPPIDTLPYFGSMYTFPLFFGTTLFAVEAVGVVVALENNMQSPKSFGGRFGVLNVSMIFVAILYLLMGVFGYWKYGENTQSSITLNLPKDSFIPKVVQAMYSISIFISYGLQGFVAIDILWGNYLRYRVIDSKYPRVWEYCLRVTTVLITFLLAISIPFLGLFISLFGAICLSALGIAFPAIIDLCVQWHDEDVSRARIVLKNSALVVLGILGLLAGSYSCISEIITQFYERTD